MTIARGRHGAVVGPHHLATEAGLATLRLGGSAVDAAIATNAVLAVVMPNGCGIGGDAFWLIWDETAGRQVALNGSGRAPAAANAAGLRDRGLRAIPKLGPLSITVPGAVRSWARAHDRWGVLSRDAVLGPAIELARGGFPAWDGLIEAIERTAPRVAAALGHETGFDAVYRPLGRRWRPGELIRLPALAATLERLAREGFDAFYEGDLARDQARGLASAGSAITAGDLGAQMATWEEPLVSSYRGVRVTTHPPNSSGLVALEMLAILERFEPPAAATFGPNGPTDPGWIHLGIEAAKLAMADRDAHLGDPLFTDVPVARLLDPAYAADLAGRIDRNRAALPPDATNPPGGGTIYLGVVDGVGNAVSLIESNYMGFGSGVVDQATGIHYQNRGSYFSLVAGHPNVLEPGKRPLHTLLAGMLFRAAEERPWIVAGAMGGDAQPQIHAQFVSSVVDGGVGIASAIGGPRWFVEPADHFLPPIEVRAEPRFEPGVLERLEALGHPVSRTEAFDSALGHEHAIELVAGGPAAPGGSLAAATDPRSAGLPAVF